MLISARSSAMVFGGYNFCIAHEPLDEDIFYHEFRRKDTTKSLPLGGAPGV